MCNKFKIGKDIYSFTFLLSLAIIVFSCNQKSMKEASTKSTDSIPLVSVRPFGNMETGQAVSLFTMRNRKGMEMSVMNYGGIIVSLNVPDRNGVSADITAGYDSLAHYEKASPFFGALIGRYGNRIAKGKFILDGTPYTLPLNNGANHLHGGPKGFDKAFWDIQDVSDSAQAKLKLTYQSKDGEQGYPGNLEIEVLYTLTQDSELKIEYHATTDASTIINLTQHAYFNLSGHDGGNILGHQLALDADSFLPVDETLIPTGILQPVKGTPFDFLSLQTIGSRINQKDDQLAFGKGYDHCWALNNNGKFGKAATLVDTTSGRRMEVFTDQPGIQFYTGNFLDGKNIGKGGNAYQQRTAVCLETQHFPDSPNKPKFPTVTLHPGETYQTITVYKFSIVD